jgi:VWFA-related protein
MKKARWNACIRIIILGLFTDIVLVPQMVAQTKEVTGERGNTPPASVNQVGMNVLVKDQKGNAITGLKPENFTIYEDDVKQKISHLTSVEADINVVLLIENSEMVLVDDVWNAISTFASSLRPGDWLAAIGYDAQQKIFVDFTRDRNKFHIALNGFKHPASVESNLFDALVDTMDRTDEMEGKKAIVLIGTGQDTFSRHTYEQALAKCKASNVPILVIRLQNVRLSRNSSNSGTDAKFDVLMADTHLKSFSDFTGGVAVFPRSMSELPMALSYLSAILRSQYNITYNSTNPTRADKFRTIRVEISAVQLAENVEPTHFTVLTRKGYQSTPIIPSVQSTQAGSASQQREQQTASSKPGQAESQPGNSNGLGAVALDIAKQAVTIETDYLRRKAEMNRAAANQQAGIQQQQQTRSTERSNQQGPYSGSSDPEADIGAMLAQAQREIDKDPEAYTLKIQQLLAKLPQEDAQDQRTSQSTGSARNPSTGNPMLNKTSDSAAKPQTVLFPELAASPCARVVYEDGGRRAGGVFGGNGADVENRCAFPITVAFCSLGGDFDCKSKKRFDFAGIEGYKLSTVILQPGASSMISSGANDYGNGFVFFACNAENSQTTAILASIDPPQGNCYIAAYSQKK